jgi:hypothetical protein
MDEWKRNRLTRAGADIVIPDYRRPDKIEEYIFQGKVILNAV